MEPGAILKRLLPESIGAEEYRQRLFVLIASGIGLPTLAYFVGQAFLAGVTEVWLICVVGFILLALQLVSLFRAQFNLWAPRTILAYISFVFWLNLYLVPGPESLYWSLVVPVLALFVFGTREGLVWTLTFLALLGTEIVLLDVRKFGNVEDFIFAYINLSVFAFGYEMMRDRAEIHAREREARLERFVDVASDWLFELDADLRFSYISPRFEQVSGYPAEMFLGQSVMDQDALNESGASLAEIMRHHQPVRDFYYSFTNPRGERIFVTTRANPHFDEEGNFLGYTGSSADITDYQASLNAVKETEQQLSQSQKMEAIGQLTSGIAHDFNNLLTVIMGYIDLLKMQGQGASHMLEALEKAADRASQLTRRILSFSRERTSHPEVMDACRALKGMTSLLTRTLGEQVQLHMDVGEHDLLVLADTGQFDSAILNLAINARDAMHGSGNLHISAHPTRVDTDVGEFVLVQVRDDGVGIAPDLVDRVTEPFFSTKPQGQGTGLGLSMVNGFVTQCNGFMAIDSEEGRGTTVKLYLPMASSTGTSDNEVKQAPSARVEKTVLVIEDDPEVSNIVDAMLSSSGYTTDIARIGEDGLRMLAERRPDIVLSDIVLAGQVSGIDIAREVRRSHPDVSIVLMSGYPDMASGDLDDVPLLRKPFTRAALLEALASADHDGASANLAGPNSGPDNLHSGDTDQHRES